MDALSALAPVTDFQLFRKGDLSSSRPNARVNRISGIKWRASDGDFDDLDLQQSETLVFLEQHTEVLAAMRQVSGVESAGVDFGISMRNVIVQTDTFRVDLLRKLASLGLSLTLSQYPSDGKNKKLKQYRRELRNF